MKGIGVKTRVKCACLCECPIVVLVSTSVVCESCVGGDHWDPKYNLDWTFAFVYVILAVMGITMIAWVLAGGMALP